MRIVHSPHYGIGFMGLERLHPFDSRKHDKILRSLRKELGRGIDQAIAGPESPLQTSDLLHVHAEDYLLRLRNSHYVAKALEIPRLGGLPAWLLDRFVLRPMRWVCAGTIVALRSAIETCGFAVNLGGGFHHAKRNSAEGFCFYSDIGLAMDYARRNSLIHDESRIVYVDLDAHMGNGVANIVCDDPRIFLFDMFNSQIYPRDDDARERIDCLLPLHGQTSEQEYLDVLFDRLPPFLDSVGHGRAISLAIYQAGTDVLSGDLLGGLNVTPNGVVQRDLFVVRQLASRKIPTVMLLGGGYTAESYLPVVRTITELWEET